MRKYRPRIADEILKEKLKGKGAVLIEGAKWCGKTTSASQIAKSILYMQDPEKVKQNLELAEIKPSKLLEGNTPRLIDEWQMAPQLWDAIRFSVDQREAFGQFILTGSSVPADMSKVYHSGAGRITKMLMRPMSLFESGDSNGTVSLQELFNGHLDIDSTNSIDIDNLSFLICRGGWPKSLNCPDKVALQQASDYYSVIIDTDISKVDNVHRNKGRAHRLMRTYSRFIGSQATLQSISSDLQTNEAQIISDDTNHI